jgi:hypothetical protein
MRFRSFLLFFSFCMLALVFVATCPVRVTAQGTRIAYGQTVEGALTSAQPDALYAFNAEQGDIIVITMSAQEGALDPFLILLDSRQQQVLAVDDNSGGGQNARLRFVILTPAEYLIKAATRGGYGTFALALNRLNPTPSPFANAPRLAPAAESVQAELNDDIRFHLYALRARSGDALRFTLESSNDLQAGMYLYDAALARRLGGAELGQPLDVVAPADGAYFLVVARIGGGGSYTLRRLSESGGSFATPDAPDGAILVPGQAQTNDIGPRLGVVFTFDGRAGAVIRADIDSEDGIEVVSILADASLQQLAAGEGGFREVPLPRDGQYYVLVIARSGPSDTRTGKFSLTLQSKAPARTATPQPDRRVIPITYGSSVSGELSDAQPLYYYGFQGVQGESATIRASEGVVLYLYLYESGKPTPVANAANGRISGLVLPATGPYLVVVSRAVGAIKTQFTLTLSR